MMIGDELIEIAAVNAQSEPVLSFSSFSSLAAMPDNISAIKRRASAAMDKGGLSQQFTTLNYMSQCYLHGISNAQTKTERS